MPLVSVVDAPPEIEIFRSAPPHRRPFVLPGGRAVLFVVGTSKITSFDDYCPGAALGLWRVRAVWQPDGRAVTYVRGLDVIRVPFSGSSGAELGLPVRLFSLERDDLLLDVLPDGRSVVLRRAQAPSPLVNVVTNWLDHVRRSMGQ